MAQHSTLQRKISLRDFEKINVNGRTAWEQTSEAQDLFAQIKAYQSEEKLYERQKLRLATDKPRKSLRRSFLELFTTSKIGLEINSAGQGKRDSGEQSRFRKAVIESYNSAHPNFGRKNEFLWDPILNCWIPERETQAAHLFAYNHGQTTMNAIFGPMNPPELFSPLNGLLLSSMTESLFDKGFFTVVPNLPENPSEKDVAAWNSLKVKEYKIRILNFQHPKIDFVIHPIKPELTWRSLNGSKLEFRNDFRPRARYLYFHYCLQILRLSWGHQKKNAEALKKKLGKAYWGTPGRYLPRHMLLAFVEELGHEYKPLLLQGAIEDEADLDPADLNSTDSETLLKAALDQVKAPAIKDDGSDVDDEDDDDNEDNECCPSNANSGNPL